MTLLALAVRPNGGKTLEVIRLGDSGRSTTRLGFGCSSIMGGLGRRDSLRMLEAAWDAGIRHFDVAPSYGFGEAEACVGEFLRRHRSAMTVTTKFGIAPAGQSVSARAVRAVARPLMKALPGLRGMRRGSAQAAGSVFPPLEPVAPAGPPNPIFTADRARKSLENSLAALKTERIDVWLLHEATANDLTDEVLRVFEDAVRAGRVGTFGVGSGRARIGALVERYPAVFPVLQYEWSIFDPLPAYAHPFRIHHRSLTSNFRLLHTALLAEPARCARWSGAAGVDLTHSAMFAKLMLKAALAMNPESVILFSSKSPHHIEENVQVAEDDRLSVAATELYRAVQADRAPI